jgi:hypothetical protein
MWKAELTKDGYVSSVVRLNIDGISIDLVPYSNGDPVSIRDTLNDLCAVFLTPSSWPDIQWIDSPNGSRLAGGDFAGQQTGVWFDKSDGKWSSNTPPISGTWSTREEGKAAIMKALIKQHSKALADLYALYELQMLMPTSQ